MTNKSRLDYALVTRKLVETRSQADNLIRLGEVQVAGRVIKKTGYYVSEEENIKITANDRYVSRAGLKLASIANEFGLVFSGRVVLDVGSSTGGFTDFALQHGANKVIAVDVGTNQLHPKLRNNDKIELHEQTDIRNVVTEVNDRLLNAKNKIVIEIPDIVVIDVSFISLREILPHIFSIVNRKSLIVAMLKPQFEADAGLKHKGVIKNERIRRQIIKNFEDWLKKYFVIIKKADSMITGSKGNKERFYLLNIIK